MLSKLFRYGNRFSSIYLLRVKVGYPMQPTTLGHPRLVPSRGFLGLIPPSQYDIPIPNKLRLMWAMREYWEIIPLVITTVFSFFILFVAILWACKNKVDVVYTTYSRDNISRTMDLRNPSIHKMMVINQRYEPWPEMQKVLDMMAAAEKRAITRLQSCSYP